MHFVPIAIMSTPESFIPLGTVIAIGSTASWTPPISGAIKEGWALANGVAYPTGSNPNFTGSMPNLSDNRFLQGSTVVGSTGGSNTTTLTTAMIPTLTDTARTSLKQSVYHSHVITPSIGGQNQNHTHVIDPTAVGTVDTGHLHYGAAGSAGVTANHTEAIISSNLTFKVYTPSPVLAGTNSGSFNRNMASNFNNSAHQHFGYINTTSYNSVSHSHSGTTDTSNSAYHTHPISLTTVGGTGESNTHTHTFSPTFGGTNTALENRPYYFDTVFLIAVANSVSLPLGTILPLGTESGWTPAASGPKDGWALCNGQTIAPFGVLPDLTASRFLEGSTSINATNAGANSRPIAPLHLPLLSASATVSGPNSVSHNHTVSGNTTEDGATQTHKHTYTSGTQSANHMHAQGGGTISSDNSANHTHYFGIYNANPNTGGGNPSGYLNTTFYQGTSSIPNVEGGHTHTLDPFTSGGEDRGHGHAVTTTSGRSNVHSHSWVAFNTGYVSTDHTHPATFYVGVASPAALENRPLYYTVRYLMKVA